MLSRFCFYFAEIGDGQVAQKFKITNVPDHADWDLSEKVIHSALEIHTSLGPGLLEHVYEECLCWKLAKSGLSFQRQVAVPIRFEEMNFPGAFRLDIIVEKRLIVEVKSIEKLIDIHKAQLLTYLKMTGLKSGLLINFNSSPLKSGIKRVETL
jgi:GxxExxY protein